MVEAHLSLTQARRIALHCQLLDGRAKLKRGLSGALALVEQLGYIQIDTIAVIERAHHHTLWTRLPRYRPDWLQHAHEVERSVFEYWGHAACYLPMSDYRFYLPLMRRHREQPRDWSRQQRELHGRMMSEVLARIKSEGPLTTSDFENPPGRSSAWWGWKPAKAALEMLFWEGELMISGRRNFQRVYDLTERVLPPGTDTREPDAAELGRFMVQRALNANGFADLNEIVGHLRIAARAVPAAALDAMLQERELVEVTVDGVPGRYFAQPEALSRLMRLRKAAPRLQLLSPFDNLAIQRERLRRLFNFDYTIECYTPAPKRRYGYFTLPILWGEQLVGRLDPKADRKAGVLLARNVVLEPGFKPDAEFAGALAAKLREFAEFNCCTGVEVERARPAALKRELRRRLQS